MSACVDYVHFDDYGHCYCQIVEDYRGIAKMSYRLHRKKKKKKELGISAWFGISGKRNLYFFIVLIYF